MRALVSSSLWTMMFVATTQLPQTRGILRTMCPKPILVEGGHSRQGLSHVVISNLVTSNIDNIIVYRVRIYAKGFYPFAVSAAALPQPRRSAVSITCQLTVRAFRHRAIPAKDVIVVGVTVPKQSVIPCLGGAVFPAIILRV